MLFQVIETAIEHMLDCKNTFNIVTLKCNIFEVKHVVNNGLS